MTTEIPAKDYLLSVFEYKDGSLVWRSRPNDHFKTARTASMWNAKFSGKVAGREMADGRYRQVMVDGVRYLEHRIIASLFDIDTTNEIDHIDGNGLNNKVENLRAATRSQNMRNNSGWAKKESRTGIHKKANGTWTAYIRLEGSHKHLGTYKSQEEAVAARSEAEANIYGEFARK